MTWIFYSNVLKCRVKSIQKRTARKLYEFGVQIYLHPCKMRFDNPWQPPLPYRLGEYDDNRSFDEICNAFRYYNCDSERGKYIHFFVKC